MIIFFIEFFRNDGDISKTSATIEIDRLFRKAFASRGDGGLPEVLNFLRRFHRYSIWNAAMIRLQRPGTLAVATVSEWSKRDRFVNAETIAIIILQPFGPIDLVYEWSALTTSTAAPLSVRISIHRHNFMGCCICVFVNRQDFLDGAKPQAV